MSKDHKQIPPSAQVTFITRYFSPSAYSVFRFVIHKAVTVSFYSCLSKVNVFFILFFVFFLIFGNIEV